MVSFTNGPDRINVYYSRMTVCTVIDHPKHGRNSLYRRRVTFNELEKILQNPRVHLGSGYHRRNPKHERNSDLPAGSGAA